ncbi:MAG: heat shock protein HspQ [Phycisphaerales bacterium]
MIMLKQPSPEAGRPERDPLYGPGQIVRHRRYGYRGVVVAFDRTCEADEAWYQSNQTRPDRRQPWYHVLVDGSSTTTYAAQTSLAPDECAAPITHPYLDHFFTEFTGDRYVRNDRPWPS